MTELVPRRRRPDGGAPGTAVKVRTVGGNLRQVTGTKAEITGYVQDQLDNGVRVKLHETRRPDRGMTVTRIVELIPHAERGPAPWWLIGASVLLALAVIGTATIMGMLSITHLVVAHPIASIIGAVLIAAFGTGGITFVINIGRR